jgi:hypothetical protein
MAEWDNPTFQRLKELIVANPIASVAVAFVLGFIISRIF